jgi:hypothetical protein
MQNLQKRRKPWFHETETEKGQKPPHLPGPIVGGSTQMLTIQIRSCMFQLSRLLKNVGNFPRLQKLVLNELIAKLTFRNENSLAERTHFTKVS